MNAVTAKIMELYNNGLSIAAIGEAVDKSRKSVEKTIATELERQERKEINRQKRELPIIETYKRTQSIKETAAIVGKSMQSIYKVLAQNNIELAEISKEKSEKINRIVKAYYEHGSIERTASALNVCNSTVYNALKSANISPTSIRKPTEKTQAIIDDIIKSSRKKGWAAAIARKHGVTRQYVEQTAKKYNVK